MEELVFSEKEEITISELRERLADVLTPDMYVDDFELHKWLKARNSDLKKAEDMYRTALEYKQKMRTDTLMDEYTPPQVLDDYMTGGFCGVDKQCSPIRVELFGRLDMRGLMRACTKSQLEKCKLLQCEQIRHMWREHSTKIGRRVDGLTVIFDMEQVGTNTLWKPGLDMYLYLVKVLEDNYPEMMKRMYVINAPAVFPILFKMCQPLISKDMKEKIKVLGGDYQSVLLEDIDAEQLPACYGGTQVDPDGDPRCPSKICQGGEVPADLYLAGGVGVAVDHRGGNMETCTVASGKKLTLDFVVDKPGDVLRWEFRTEDYDIGFGVLRFLEDNTAQEVEPMQRYNCLQAHDGTLICQHTGTYAILFDNRHSWLRSKTLYYSLLLNETPCSLLISEC